MTERQTKVSLKLMADDYIRGARDAADATRQIGTEAEKLAQQRESFQEVGQAMLALGTVAAAGVGIAVKTFADFDQAMSNVAATGADATQNIDALRQAALDAGARTVFSATESANAIEELSKAGLSASDILSGALDGALDLAAAGGLAVADAAGIAATALQQFGLEGDDASHVADLLAAGAGKAMGDVSDLSQALNQAGLVADQTGLSIEETTAGLSAFASAGLLGSDAGTSFKSMLQRLTPQSAEAQAKMDELGISAYDAQGNFVGLSEFAGNLQTSLSDLTTEQRNSALATIFGSDAVRAATVLYSEGADGVEDWEEKVNDSGYAAETAAKRLDNLKGDVEQLGGAFETALIQTGEPLNDMLRGMVQAVTEVINAYNGAPAPVKTVVSLLGAATAAAGLAGGAFFLAVPKVAAFNAAMATMPVNLQRSVAAMGTVVKFLTGPWGLGLAAASVGVGVLAGALDELKVSGAELENALRTASTATELFESLGKGREWTAFRDVTADLGNMEEMLNKVMSQDTNWWERFTTETIGFRNALRDAGDQLGSIAQTDLPEAQEAFRMLAEQTDGSDAQLQKLLEQMPGYKDALLKVANAQDIQLEGLSDTEKAQVLLNLAMGEAESATQSATDEYMEQADKVADLKQKLTDLIDTLNEANGVGQDAVSQNINYQETLDDVAEHIQKIKDGVEGYSEGIDTNTEAGRRNLEMLNGLAEDSQAAAEAQYQVDLTTMSATEATALYIERLKEGRQKLIDSAVAAGVSEEAAKDLADQIYKVPTERETKFLADTAAAQQQIDWYMQHYGTRTGTIIYRAQLPDTNGAASGNGKMGTYEDGGMIVHANAVGNIYDYDPGIYAGGPLYKFAEPNLPWEAFISGKAGQEPRNINIAYDALARLGALPQPVQAAAPQVSVSPQVSLAGATLKATIDGRPLEIMINDQISAFSSRAGSRVSSGKKKYL